MRFGVISLAALLLAAVAVQAPSVVADEDTTVEYKLAVVQTGAVVAPDDPLVLAYADALDRVQPRCSESRLQLGSIAVALISKMQEQGIYTASPLSLLQGLDAAASPGLYGPDNPANCAQLLAVVAYLASQGD